jgi:hypothetical protein
MGDTTRRWLFPLLVVGAVVVGGIAAAEVGRGRPTVTVPVPGATDDATSTPSTPRPPQLDSADPGGGHRTTRTPDPDDGTEAGAHEVQRSWGSGCGQPVGNANHGAYVASTPHDGASRSAAARSSCGMPSSSPNATPSPSASARAHERGAAKDAGGGGTGGSGDENGGGGGDEPRADDGPPGD